MAGNKRSNDSVHSVPPRRRHQVVVRQDGVVTTPEGEHEHKRRVRVSNARAALAALAGLRWSDLTPRQKDVVMQAALMMQGLLDADGVVIIDIGEV